MKRKIKPKITNRNTSHVLKMKLKGNCEIAIDVLNRIKKSKSDELFNLYRETINRETINRETLERITGTKKPTKINQLLSTKGMLHSASIANEIIWTISTCLLYKNELKYFIEKEKRLKLRYLIMKTIH
ncbi:TPA: hypothetical protein J1181_004974 [Escherichia coli]|nr:hypothetical protein [Escherichia coli]HBB0122537.1 hypothetical protein [Escherichia coli]